jgi:hypothetical protein
VKHYIQAALAVVYRTEADARIALEIDDDVPYLGVWERPEAEAPPLHVFSDDIGVPDVMRRRGWWRPADREPA